MPLSKKPKGGRNHRKIASKNISQTRELTFKEHGQEYAQVLKLLGCARFELYCFDGQTRLGIARGKIKKRQWIKPDDIVLIGLRSYQNEKCDIILRYTPEETRILIIDKHLPDNIKIVEDDTGFNNISGDNIIFDDMAASEDLKSPKLTHESADNLDNVSSISI